MKIKNFSEFINESKLDQESMLNLQAFIKSDSQFLVISNPGDRNPDPVLGIVDFLDTKKIYWKIFPDLTKAKDLSDMAKKNPKTIIILDNLEKLLGNKILMHDLATLLSNPQYGEKVILATRAKEDDVYPELLDVSFNKNKPVND